jgi:hypothetical protein
VLGIGHYSRTGKSTLCNAILSHLEKIAPEISAKEASFAAKMKEIAFELYGWDGLQNRDFYERKENEHLRRVKLPTIGLTPVEIWCKLGTEVGRAIYQDTWVQYILRNTEHWKVIVTPDVRFPNEAAAIKAAGGLLVKVVRPGYGPLNTTADQALIGYDGWDLVVGGSGEMAELTKWGTRIAKWLAGGFPPAQNYSERQRQLECESLPASV